MENNLCYNIFWLYRILKKSYFPKISTYFWNPFRPQNVETVPKKWDCVFQSLWQYYFWLCWLAYMRLMTRLWEFQNGKMGLHSSKIDRDRAKNVKRKILKNFSFCVEIVFSLTRTAIFQKFCILQFLLYLCQFLG